MENLARNAFNALAPPVSRPKLAQPAVISCVLCTGDMMRTTKGETDLGRQLLGIFFFLTGVALLFAFPIGTVIGLVLMAVAAGLGRKDAKVWKCRHCETVLPRA
jgi:hypothetical protein